MLCLLFKVLNFTANGITTFSLIFGLLSLVFLWRYNWAGFAVMYYVSYFFDCMDGHYARKYKQVSKFGDYYDHIKDIIVIVGLVIILIVRYKVPVKVWVILGVIMTVATLLMIVHLGCQERIYEKKESPMLTHTRLLCIRNPEETIKFTRLFGCGTWTLILIFAVLYISMHNSHVR